MQRRHIKVGFVLCAIVTCALIGLQTYRNNVAQGELKGELSRIEKNTKEPPKVEVNIPPATVNPPQVKVSIPPQMAYLGVTQPGVNSSSYRIGFPLEIVLKPKNLSSSVVAQEASTVRGAWIVSTTLDGLKQQVVSDPEQDRAYWEIKASISKLGPPTLQTFGPSQDYIVSAVTEPINASLDDALRRGAKTILLYVQNDWRDQSGHHANEFCAWLQVRSDLFSGPGVMASTVAPMWYSCSHHNGLKF
jgi:hypothetical protein